MNWSHHFLLRLVSARPRLFIAVAVGLATAYGLPTHWISQSVTRALLAWNVGTTLYVVLTASMMWRSTQHHMQRRAQLQDEGQRTVLVLVVLSGLASLVGIAAQLAMAKDMHAWAKWGHMALAGFTVLSSWAFIQLIFALHYAHDYYAAAARGRSPGLAFPQDAQPDYGDFFYFSAVIGTSGQTADVAFVSKPMRRIGTVHCILAYLFNTTVLALLINMGASLL